MQWLWFVPAWLTFRHIDSIWPAYMSSSASWVSTVLSTNWTCLSRSSWSQRSIVSCFPGQSTAVCHQNCRQQLPSFQQLCTEQTTAAGYRQLTTVWLNHWTEHIKCHVMYNSLHCSNIISSGEASIVQTEQVLSPTPRDHFS